MQEMIGHEVLRQQLQTVFQREATLWPHAFLLAGPSGVGKQTLLRSLMASLVCEQGVPAQSSCGVCRVCVLLEKRTFTDLHEAPQEGTTISVDWVRSVQEAIAHTSVEGGWRFVLISRAERLTVPAANALLKTLEEPPSRTLLFLTAAATDAVLPTIASRCLTFSVGLLSDQDAARAIQNALPSCSHEERALLSQLAGGAPGTVVEWGASKKTMKTLLEQCAWFASIPSRSLGERCADMKRLAKEERVVVDQRLSLWIRLLHLVLQSPVQLASPLAPVVEAYASDSGDSQQVVQEHLQRALETRQRIRDNGNVRMALEAFVCAL